MRGSRKRARIFPYLRDKFNVNRLYHGWLIVAATFMTGGLIIGSSQYAFGAFVEPLERDLGWTRTQINLSLSFAAVANMIAPILGRLIDRYGARPVMVVSLLLFSASFLLRPFMTELWHWYALSAIQFIAFPGAVFLPVGKLVGLWFQETRGRVMGITAMGNNVGGLILAPMAGFLVGFASWEWTFASFGFIGLLITAFVFFVVRDDPKDVAAAAAKVGRVGNAALSGATAEGRTSMALIGLTVQQAIRTRAFYTIAMGLVAATFTFSTALTQLVPHLENEGYSLTQASLILSLTAVFGMAGKIIFGYMAERIPVRYTVIISLVGQALALVIIVTVPKSPMIWLFIPIYGVAFGGLGPLISLLVQDTFGLRHYASIQGLVGMASVVSFFAGPLMAGMIFDSTESYRITFTILAVLFIAGSVILTQARPPKGVEAAMREALGRLL